MRMHDREECNCFSCKEYREEIKLKEKEEKEEFEYNKYIEEGRED